jgi:hypothetical protein
VNLIEMARPAHGGNTPIAPPAPLPRLRPLLDRLRQARPAGRRAAAHALADAVLLHPPRKAREYIVWLAVELARDRDRLR